MRRSGWSEFCPPVNAPGIDDITTARIHRLQGGLPRGRAVLCGEAGDGSRCRQIVFTLPSPAMQRENTSINLPLALETR
ncbi:hypothetical protein PBY51_011330 [Eleginops maclovinus]|uniref:Uncharacterized protein n=1 Tax=Eleginops maclovinus TaxID=56733 RepID=A0AAN7XSV9_ELEMC|nr:hypothetical protein PBY51_011330 [Eleginops maclovinus]